MAKQKELNFQEELIQTVLAEDIKFKGALKFSNSLMIKGIFEGEIQAEQGHLFVGEKAEIKANISAKNVSNKGKIFGNIKTKEKFELFNTGLTNGDITSNDLYIESGSVFNGKSTMKKNLQKPDKETTASNKQK